MLQAIGLESGQAPEQGLRSSSEVRPRRVLSREGQVWIRVGTPEGSDSCRRWIGGWEAREEAGLVQAGRDEA